MKDKKVANDSQQENTSGYLLGKLAVGMRSYTTHVKFHPRFDDGVVGNAIKC